MSEISRVIYNIERKGNEVIFISALLTHENEVVVDLAKEYLNDDGEGKVHVPCEIADKFTEDLMDFSVRKFINSIDELKSENEKLKVIIESSDAEITKHKDKTEYNNIEITKLNDKLKVANNVIKEKNSLIADLSTRMDKLEKNLNEKFGSFEKEVKKTVPTLNGILVNVKEERKALSKLQNLESGIKGIENNITKNVLDGIKAILQDLCIDKEALYIYNKDQNDDALDPPHQIQEKDKLKTQSQHKEEIFTGKYTEEEEDDELCKMLNDIKRAIM